MPKKTFNLRVWFALGSLGTIMLIFAGAAWSVSGFMTRSLLERESEVSQEFMESIVNVNGTAMFHDDGSEPLQQNPLIVDFAKHILGMPGVLRVNIHAPTRRILWSTETQIIGKKFDRNDELDEAFDGHRVTEIGRQADSNKPEHVALEQTGYFIEAYIPLHLEIGHGPVVGVVEFYKQPLTLDATIRRGQQLVWTGAVVGATMLFMVLYWIVQRGALLIEGQQQSLARMEAFAAIGQMSSAVAHSLRNPMSAIRSSAELWRSQQPVDNREVTDEIIGEVDRMDRYVRDLLAYARAEPYHLQPVDPAKVIGAILAKQQRAIERNRITVKTVDHPGAPAKVKADEMLLEQALTSVLTNSIEAMADGGRLDISIGAGADPGRIRVEIADTGRGIPAELLKRVAESYFTTKARGLGLGLVLARGIIERFGGRLDLVSARNVGTTVYIDLEAA